MESCYCTPWCGVFLKEVHNRGFLNFQEMGWFSTNKESATFGMQLRDSHCKSAYCLVLIYNMMLLYCPAFLQLVLWVTDTERSSCDPAGLSRWQRILFSQIQRELPRKIRSIICVSWPNTEWTNEHIANCQQHFLKWCKVCGLLNVIKLPQAFCRGGGIDCFTRKSLIKIYTQ